MASCSPTAEMLNSLNRPLGRCKEERRTDGRRSSRGSKRKLYSVHVSRLPLSIAKDDLYDMFQHCGEIGGIHISLPRDDMQFVYGFVRFTEMSSAEKAIAEMDGKQLGRWHLKVEFSKDIQEETSRALYRPKTEGAHEMRLLWKLKQCVSQLNNKELNYVQKFLNDSGGHLRETEADPICQIDWHTLLSQLAPLEEVLTEPRLCAGPMVSLDMEMFKSVRLFPEKCSVDSSSPSLLHDPDSGVETCESPATTVSEHLSDQLSCLTEDLQLKVTDSLDTDKSDPGTYESSSLKASLPVKQSSIQELRGDSEDRDMPDFEAVESIFSGAMPLYQDSLNRYSSHGTLATGLQTFETDEHSTDNLTDQNHDFEVRDDHSIFGSFDNKNETVNPPRVDKIKSPKSPLGTLLDYQSKHSHTSENHDESLLGPYIPPHSKNDHAELYLGHPIVTNNQPSYLGSYQSRIVTPVLHSTTVNMNSVESVGLAPITTAPHTQQFSSNIQQVTKVSPKSEQYNHQVAQKTGAKIRGENQRDGFQQKTEYNSNMDVQKTSKTSGSMMQNRDRIGMAQLDNQQTFSSTGKQICKLLNTNYDTHKADLTENVPITLAPSMKEEFQRAQVQAELLPSNQKQSPLSSDHHTDFASNRTDGNVQKHPNLQDTSPSKSAYKQGTFQGSTQNNSPDMQSGRRHMTDTDAQRSFSKQQNSDTSSANKHGHHKKMFPRSKEKENNIQQISPRKQHDKNTHQTSQRKQQYDKNIHQTSPKKQNEKPGQQSSPRKQGSHRSRHQSSPKEGRNKMTCYTSPRQRGNAPKKAPNSSSQQCNESAPRIQLTPPKQKNHNMSVSDNKVTLLDFVPPLEPAKSQNGYTSKCPETVHDNSHADELNLTDNRNNSDSNVPPLEPIECGTDQQRHSDTVQVVCTPPLEDTEQMTSGISTTSSALSTIGQALGLAPTIGLLSADSSDNESTASAMSSDSLVSLIQDTIHQKKTKGNDHLYLQQQEKKREKSLIERVKNFSVEAFDWSSSDESRGRYSKGCAYQNYCEKTKGGVSTPGRDQAINKQSTAPAETRGKKPTNLNMQMREQSVQSGHQKFKYEKVKEQFAKPGHLNKEAVGDAVGLNARLTPVSKGRGRGIISMMNR